MCACINSMCVCMPACPRLNCTLIVLIALEKKQQDIKWDKLKASSLFTVSHKQC